MGALTPHMPDHLPEVFGCRPVEGEGEGETMFERPCAEPVSTTMAPLRTVLLASLSSSGCTSREGQVPIVCKPPVREMTPAAEVGGTGSDTTEGAVP